MAGFSLQYQGEGGGRTVAEDVLAELDGMDCMGGSSSRGTLLPAGLVGHSRGTFHPNSPHQLCLEGAANRAGPKELPGQSESGTYYSA